ncbi:MAG: sulfatase [Anaerolineae bacterium]|nr:sulfatase [Anaerolineae bacterium]
MEPQRPDILLIVLDTLRADRLSCYGYPRLTTPHIDAFARRATLYERAISPAQWTIPAHASLFTGEYPSTHQTTQVYDKHSPDYPTLAEMLAGEGYHTVGFCNNVLLGVVSNDLDRGFHEFYNYGGSMPNRPPVREARPGRLGRIAQRITQPVRRIAAPIQDAFARNDRLLRIAYRPWIIPLWHRFMNSKGDTALSIRDMVGYVRARRRQGVRRPLFAFVNLMETHLPYGPPRRFIRRFAPYYAQDRAARAFLRRYNLEYYRWLVPLVDPLPADQARVLNDLYDAELAYEDHLLRALFRYLEEPGVRENTMVILTSDHGEGLNHHGLVGHSLFAYDDLLHVPLVIRYPRLYPAGVRVGARVSTRRVFYSALEAAGIGVGAQGHGGGAASADGVSLARAVDDAGGEKERVYAESFPPATLLALMAHDDPDALERYRCRLARRAVYEGAHKLIAVDGRADELFDVQRDANELDNRIEAQPQVVAELERLLAAFVDDAEGRRAGAQGPARANLEQDPKVVDRLRHLGYIG